MQQLKTTTEKQAARIALQARPNSDPDRSAQQQADQIQKVSAQLENDPPDTASRGESIKLLLRNAVEVSGSSIHSAAARTRAAAVLFYERLRCRKATIQEVHGASHREAATVKFAQFALQNTIDYTALCVATETRIRSEKEFQMTNNFSETLTLGHSPDPDDAFMFYAIAKNKIDLRGYRV